MTDEPYFSRASMLRRVQSDRLVGLTYGLRAVYIGALHPVAFTGTYLHTREMRTPVSRLADTAKLFEAVSLGSRAQADRALAITAAKHRKVHGTLGRDVGPFPAATAYTAYDPDLMLWTWAVLADSSIVLYETFAGRLPGAEREALYQDWVRWAELFRMPPGAAPATHAAFVEWFDAELRSPQRHLTPLAKRTAETVCFTTPLPVHLRSIRHLNRLIVLGTTPEPVRRHFGHSWSRLDAAEFRAFAAAVRAGRIVVPRGPVSGIFDGLAAHEQRRVARGHDTIRGIATEERNRSRMRGART